VGGLKLPYHRHRCLSHQRSSARGQADARCQTPVQQHSDPDTGDGSHTWHIEAKRRDTAEQHPAQEGAYERRHIGELPQARSPPTS
jgi:hypothetical protein